MILRPVRLVKQAEKADRVCTVVDRVGVPESTSVQRIDNPQPAGTDRQTTSALQSFPVVLSLVHRDNINRATVFTGRRTCRIFPTGYVSPSFTYNVANDHATTPHQGMIAGAWTCMKSSLRFLPLLADINHLDHFETEWNHVLGKHLFSSCFEAALGG